MGAETTKAYSSDDVEVSFDSSVCQHAARCWQELPQVFHPKVRPWITPAEASAEEVVAQVKRCPSGALQYRLLAGD